MEGVQELEVGKLHRLFAKLLIEGGPGLFGGAHAFSARGMARDRGSQQLARLPDDVLDLAQ